MIIIIAVGILLIIIIIAIVYNPVWAQKSYILTHCTESPWDVYLRSSGNFDDAAMLALRRAVDRNNTTPSDYLLAATIILNNAVSAAPNPQTQSELVNDVREYYMLAIRNMDAVSDICDRYTNTQVIDDVIHFANRYPSPDLLAVADLKYNMLIEHWKTCASPAAHYDIAIERNLLGTTSEYDIGITACINKIINTLRDEQKEDIPTVSDIINVINASADKFSDGRPYRVADVIAVINSMDRADGGEYLRRVWCRASHPNNIIREARMQRDIFDALLNSWVEGVDGRSIICSRGCNFRVVVSILERDYVDWVVRRFSKFKCDLIHLAKKQATKNIIDEYIDDLNERIPGVMPQYYRRYLTSPNSLTRSIV